MNEYKGNLKLIFFVGNIIILITLLIIWIDKFEIFFDSNVLFREVFKIVSINILALIFSFYLGKKANQNKKRTAEQINFFVFLIFFGISLNLYISYFKNIKSHFIEHKTIRKKVFKKLSEKHNLAEGHSAYNLTYKEYKFLSSTIYLPILEEKSYNISYEFGKDGFLPDYYFDIVYHLPKDQTKGEVKIKNNDLEIVVKVKQTKNDQIVKYRESNR